MFHVRKLDMEMSSDSLEDGGVMNEMSFTVVVVYRYRRTGIVTGEQEASGSLGTRWCTTHTHTRGKK